MRNLVLAIALLGISGLYSQSARTAINHVTLVVTDLEKSKEFYVGILQLEQIETPWWGDDDPYMFLSLGKGGELHIGEIEGIEVKPNGYNHFAISVADLDAFLQDLRSKGITYGGLGKDGKPWEVTTRADGVRQTFTQDPDGYWVEFNDAFR